MTSRHLCPQQAVRQSANKAYKQNIQVEGDYVSKRMTSRERNCGERQQFLASMLNARGVPTPAICHDSIEQCLRMPHIRGVSGHDFFSRKLRAMCAAPSRAARMLILKQVLTPIIALHRIEASSSGLEVFDAWRRIRPRIAALAWQCEADQMLLREAVAELNERTSPGLDAVACQRGLIIVHGDLHPGQLIQDEAGTIWLLDLDDLSAGRPESDLGNLAAHMASHPITQLQHPASDFSLYAEQLGDAYERSGGWCIDIELMHLYGALALLRRALKLWLRDKRREQLERLVGAALQTLPN